MPQSNAPFGFVPVQSFGTHGNAVRTYPLANGGSCPDLAKGSPVKLNGGYVVSVGTGGGSMLGVALGYAWVDDSTKQPRMANRIPADVSSGGKYEGNTTPIAYVVDNPHAIFMVQADASITAGDLGLNFDCTANSADDTVYGVSRHALDASTRTSAVTGAFKIVGLAKIEDNNWGDPYPVVLVKMNVPVITNTSAT